MIVQICSPAPCFQEEGHQMLCLPLLHTVFQITHQGPKRLIAKCWHCCTAISEAPFSHCSDLCSGLSSDGCIAAGGKVRRCSSACCSAWGQSRAPFPVCFYQSCSFCTIKREASGSLVSLIFTGLTEGTGPVLSKSQLDLQCPLVIGTYKMSLLLVNPVAKHLFYSY